jgi:hypothetical protein
LAGEEFGLDAGDVRSLAAATYETGRLLLGAGADADVRLAPGPALQVRFRVVEADGAARAALASQLADVLPTVRSMVHEAALDERDDELIVCLTALLPADAAGRLQACTAPRAPVPRARAVEPGSVPSRPRHDDLVAAVEELQAELQETNRGVVAL